MMINEARDTKGVSIYRFRNVVFCEKEELKKKN